MTGQGIAQILVYAVVLIALVVPARPLHGAGLRPRLPRPLAERDRGRLLPPRAHGAEPRAGLEELLEDACSSSRSSFFGVLYAIQRLQGHLFLNPDHLQGVPSHIALNTTASFVTNTNWQYYGGEYTMSYLTQMAGLAVQQFVSAGGRDGRAGRRDPRSQPAELAGARELLGRPLPLADLHPPPALADPRADPALAGRAADLRRPRDGARRSRERRRRSPAARSR